MEMGMAFEIKKETGMCSQAILESGEEKVGHTAATAKGTLIVSGLM